MRAIVISLIVSVLLTSCGKPSERPTSSDPCANAKGITGIETDAQAQQACRANKKFLGPDAKSSNTKIDNN